MFAIIIIIVIKESIEKKMNKMKDQRIIKRLRQIDLAKRAHISLTWVWALENGFHDRVSLEVKKRVARVLGSTVDELFPTENEDRKGRKG